VSAEATKGRRWPGGAGLIRAYAALWAVALIFAVVVSSYGAWLRFTQTAPVWTPYGVTANFKFRAIDEVFGAEARASGIARGDLVVAVDDVPVERIGTGLRAMRRALARAPGDAVVLTLRGPTTGITRHRLHWQAANVAAGGRLRGSAFESGWWVSTVLGLIQAAIMIGAAILLFGRRRDPVAAVFALAFLLANAYGVSERAFYEFGLFQIQMAVASLSARISSCVIWPGRARSSIVRTFWRRCDRACRCRHGSNRTSCTRSTAGSTMPASRRAHCGIL